MSYLFCRRTCSVLHGLRGISIAFRVFLRNDEVVFSGVSLFSCNSRATAELTQHTHVRSCISAQRRRYSTKSSRKLKDRMEDIWTVPNLLSTIRICLAPVIGYLVINHSYTSALVLFATAGVSDWLDGYIARHFKNQRSMLGTALDPFADKLLISILTISLAYVRIIPIPLTALFISRDIGLIGASFYIRYQSLPPPKTVARFWDIRYATTEVRPSFIGKANTVLQLGLVGLSLTAPLLDMVNHPILQVMWYITATTTIASGISYMVSKDAVKILRHTKR